MLPEWSLAAVLGVGALALIAWNFAHGARLASLRSVGRPFRVLSGLGAFLFQMNIGIVSSELKRRAE